MKTKIPSIVLNWVNTHKGERHPVFAPGNFATYAESKSSACYKQPLGGIKIGNNYRVAVAQPSPQHVGDKAMFFYDYIKDQS